MPLRKKLTKLMKKRINSMLRFNQLTLKKKLYAKFCVNILVNLIHHRKLFKLLDIFVTFFFTENKQL